MKHEPTRHEADVPSSMTRPTWLAILLVLVQVPAGAHAACTRDNPDMLENYDGTIGEGYRARMTLVFRGAQVEGLYFYATQLRDIALRGTTDGSDLVLDELDAKGTPVARFEAKFVDRDPKQRFSGKLECEVVSGTWRKLDGGQALPVYFAAESSTTGALDNRYGDARDALVHRNAFRFWDAVKRGERKTVAASITYPISVQVAGARKRLRNPVELLANYDAIFSPRYVEAIVGAVPRNMFVRDQGIMLGRGEVWFGFDGKVIGLNTP